MIARRSTGGPRTRSALAVAGVAVGLVLTGCSPALPDDASQAHEALEPVREQIRAVPDVVGVNLTAESGVTRLGLTVDASATDEQLVDAVRRAEDVLDRADVPLPHERERSVSLSRPDQDASLLLRIPDGLARDAWVPLVAATRSSRCLPDVTAAPTVTIAFSCVADADGAAAVVRDALDRADPTPVPSVDTTWTFTRGGDTRRFARVVVTGSPSARQRDAALRVAAVLDGEGVDSFVLRLDDDPDVWVSAVAPVELQPSLVRALDASGASYAGRLVDPETSTPLERFEGGTS